MGAWAAGDHTHAAVRSPRAGKLAPKRLPTSFMPSEAPHIHSARCVAATRGVADLTEGVAPSSHAPRCPARSGHAWTNWMENSPKLTLSMLHSTKATAIITTTFQRCGRVFMTSATSGDATGKGSAAAAPFVLSW